jgi:hypothetical protein
MDDGLLSCCKRERMEKGEPENPAAPVIHHGQPAQIPNPYSPNLANSLAQ